MRHKFLTLRYVFHEAHVNEIKMQPTNRLDPRVLLKVHMKILLLALYNTYQLSSLFSINRSYYYVNMSFKLPYYWKVNKARVAR